MLLHYNAYILRDTCHAIAEVVIPMYHFDFHNMAGSPAFADTSTRAYEAVAFLCKGQEISFVMAKSQVAPLKALRLYPS